MRKFFAHPFFAELAHFAMVAFITFALLLLIAMIGQELYETHSQIEAPHRDGYSVSTEPLISLTCESTQVVREEQSYELIALRGAPFRTNVPEPFGLFFAADLSPTIATAAPSIDYLNRTAFRRWCHLLALRSNTSRLEHGPVNPARLAAAYNTLLDRSIAS